MCIVGVQERRKKRDICPSFVPFLSEECGYSLYKFPLLSFFFSCPFLINNRNFLHLEKICGHINMPNLIVSLKCIGFFFSTENIKAHTLNSFFVHIQNLKII